MRLKGMRFVDSLNCSINVIEPVRLGEDSKAGDSAAVMPARVKVTDCTADAGA